MAAQKKELEQVLQQSGIKALNTMQETMLETALHDRDILLLSDTGTGKTLAFLLPVWQFLDSEKKGTQALIIVPSRELALQIEKVFRQMNTGFKITACYGGHKREIEENNLLEAPAVIVGTPGRLGDHIRRENIHTATIEWLVMDEYDKSLEMGFTEEISFLIHSLPSIRKRIFTSATEAATLPDFLGTNHPEILNFCSGEKVPEHKLNYQQLLIKDTDRPEALFQLLCNIGNRSSIIFCNHKTETALLSDYLSAKGIIHEYYHGSMEQRDRESALSKFRNGTVDFLITTDLAARGLDISHIRYIIHYGLPDTEATFTHRNGRAARMEASGTVILMIDSRQHLPPYLNEDIEIITCPPPYVVPAKPNWTTLNFSLGKKDKVSKGDIAGFIIHNAGIRGEDIGLIEVNDFNAFAAVKKSRASHTLHALKDKKIKGKKVKVQVVKTADQ
ncbi:MAG: DEAD/DEAH box helicase [Chitinophagaceae bacterium]|nr:DEAD/DEAH box helicase [Chitinophagaceae bacterium]MCW5927270.1 DEAD/DEAH box helicase [Chitinophagaceae bacterium]